MSEETKKAGKTEQEVKPAELSEQDLDKVAGGGGGPVMPKPPVTGPGVAAGGGGHPVVKAPTKKG